MQLVARIERSEMRGDIVTGNAAPGFRSAQPVLQRYRVGTESVSFFTMAFDHGDNRSRFRGKDGPARLWTCIQMTLCRLAERLVIGRARV